MAFLLDPKRSHVRAFTTTEGFLARLAHDLEIAVPDLAGEVEEGPPAHARIRVGVASIAVVGVVKKGRTDRDALAAWERSQIVGRIRDDVFSGSNEVRVEATLEDDHARLDVILPHARETVRAPVTVRRTATEVNVKGECAISLRGLGVAPLKGPMGAFVVADRVRLTFDLVFVNAGA